MAPESSCENDHQIEAGSHELQCLSRRSVASGISCALYSALSKHQPVREKSSCGLDVPIPLRTIRGWVRISLSDSDSPPSGSTSRLKQRRSVVLRSRFRRERNGTAAERRAYVVTRRDVAEAMRDMREGQRDSMLSVPHSLPLSHNTS